MSPAFWIIVASGACTSLSFIAGHLHRHWGWKANALDLLSFAILAALVSWLLP